MRRGACPSLFAPMLTGDGWLSRVKPPGSVLTAAQTMLLAEAASRWGNGVIEATGRASLQVRGLTAEGAGPFAAAMVAAGLGAPDPAVEARRNVIVSPLAGPEAGTIATALASLLAADARLGALPAKFGFLVDGGGPLGMAGVEADVCLRLQGERWLLALDGGCRAAVVPEADAAVAAVRLAHAFLALAGQSRRMRALLETVGEAAIFAAAGLCGTVPNVHGAPPHAVGEIADAFGVGLPFGTIGAADLHALADAAALHGDGQLWLTPWRVLLIAGVRDPAVLRAALTPLDLIIDPDDPRLRIAACAGRPACASATVDTRATAAALARLRPSGPIHVSGCSKGCAHPGPAALTLVGRDGAYDLVRNGRAADAPALVGLTAAQVLAQTVPG